VHRLERPLLHAYKTEMDDDAKKAMFPQNACLAVPRAA
jgi:hypothetical protein